MKILSIQNNPYKHYKNSFKAWGYYDRQAVRGIGKLKKEIKKTTAQIKDQPLENYSMETLLAIAEKLEEYREKTEYVNRVFESPRGEDNSADKIAITQYIEESLKLSQDKGLNKIYGYDDIKNKVFNAFIVKVMAQDKTTKGSNVPNAILFYGPTGCGKTLFAEALAEQSLANVYRIRAVMSGENQEQDTFDLVKSCAKKARKEWLYDPEHKKRTIFIVNEAEMFMYPESPVRDKFVDFLKVCSDRYKCTVFLTSNFPNDLDEAILSDQITPYKIYIPLASKEDTKKLITRRLELLERPPINVERLTNVIFSHENMRYTNYQVLRCIDDVRLEPDPKYDTDDYIQLLHSMTPVVSQKEADEVEKFMENYQRDIIS